MAKRAWLRFWAFLSCLVVLSREAAHEAVEHHGPPHIEVDPARNRTWVGAELEQGSSPPSDPPLAASADDWRWSDEVDDDTSWWALA